MLGMPRGRLCSYTLTLALGLSALGVGAIHLHVLVPYAVLVITSALLSCRPGAVRSLWRAFPERPPAEPKPATTLRLRRRITLGAVVWFCLTLVCWLQVAPLPLGWLEKWAPLNADIWARALRPFEAAPPELASISLAPGRTLIEALEVATYGLVFAVSARIAGRSGFASIARIIFGTTLVVALVTAAHQVLGAERLYGIYAPLNALSVAPILNHNSLAGYLNLGFCCGLGLLFRERPSPWNSLLVVGLICVAAEVILCQSRGGVACLGLGIALIFLLQALRRRSHRSQRWTLGRRLLALGLVAGGAAASAGLALRFESWHRLEDASLEKLNLLEWGSRLARAQGSLGIGRGAFGSVSFAYAGEGRNVAYDHAENVLVQWASEWGLPVTLLALLALGYALWPLARRSSLRSPTGRCGLVGCCVLLLQNLIDLGLEIPAVAAALACALGGLAGTLQRPASSQGTQPSSALALAPSSRVLLLGSLLTSVALVAALLGGSELLPRLRQQLYAQLGRSAQGRPSPEFWTELRKAMLAFPADPYFPLLGSSAALSAHKNALPWITRALERSPQHAESHLQLARILKARGATDQALVALRHALELDAGQAKPALNLLLSWELSPTLLRQAVPAGAAGAPLARLLALRSEDPATRLQWLEEAVAREPADAESQYRLALELLEDLKRKQAAVQCQDRAACARSIRDHARLGEAPDDPRGVILEAQLQAEEGNAKAAEAGLWRACERYAGNTGCDAALVELAVQNQSEQLPRAEKRYLASGCSTRENCARSELHLGNLASRAGHWNMALTHYEHATREAPTKASWQALADVSKRLGNETVEADALRRVRLLDESARRSAPVDDSPSGANSPAAEPPAPETQP
jgi:Flp pilus assembly protein TadD